MKNKKPKKETGKVKGLPPNPEILVIMILFLEGKASPKILKAILYSDKVINRAFGSFIFSVFRR
jgi:hypothetical protein